MDTDLITAARSALFTPGTRPDRFERAIACGADLMILDLEDSVPAAAKERARRAVDEWLTDGRPAAVRINAADTPWYGEDLAMVARHDCAVMLPKADRVEVVTAARAGVPLIALIETARGVIDAARICATGAVTRAAFGSVDLATEIGVDHADPVAMDHARAQVVLACAAAGLAAPLDGVTTRLGDEPALLQDIRWSRRLGYGGKLCIHPNQVGAVNDGYGPSAADIAWATRVLAAERDGDVTSVDGQMIDRPLFERARRLLRMKS